MYPHLGCLRFLVVFAAILHPFVTAELKFVIQFNRHGARAPLHKFFDISGWKEKGVLTARGMRQLYLLGAELRKRYITDKHFLPETYDPNLVLIRSTAFNRTLQSAQSLVLGLYPLGTGELLTDDYPQKKAVPPGYDTYDLLDLKLEALPSRYQPIPIHVKLPEEDELLTFEEGCPSSKRWKQQAFKSERFKTMEKEFLDNYPKLAAVANKSADAVGSKQCFQAMDTLLCDQFEGRELSLIHI
eukprot:TRINITY_DN8771_c1_g1_i2.p1 TRINITY_DN8771_c1_g1~~TRINITY_DN8771_c1_g1_i2.p1  ORF type:complete len:243 (-),score=28.37 TRINITY_DN8771_c1_g1_i2:4-732(-)